jgi:3-phytase
MPKIFIIFNLIFINLNAQEPKTLGSLLYKEVTANVETEPVFAGDDAADDMCILENFNNPENSLIISSDKKYGIIVYLSSKDLEDMISTLFILPTL